MGSVKKTLLRRWLFRAAFRPRYREARVGDAGFGIEAAVAEAHRCLTPVRSTALSDATAPGSAPAITTPI
jgi:hypothetical protein